MCCRLLSFIFVKVNKMHDATCNNKHATFLFIDKLSSFRYVHTGDAIALAESLACFWFLPSCTSGSDKCVSA